MIELESFIVDKDNNIICPLCEELMEKSPTAMLFECSNEHWIGADRVFSGVN